MDNNHMLQMQQTIIKSFHFLVIFFSFHTIFNLSLDFTFEQSFAKKNLTT
jgi:hypothetical protein